MKKSALFSIVFAFMIAGTQATIILQDDFSGTSGATVKGTTPDTLSTALSGRTWDGSASVAFDGTGGIIGAPNSYRSTVFNISGGYAATDILRLTVVLQNDESHWAGIGFATNVLETGLNDNVGWVNINGDAAATPGGGNLWEGPGTLGSKTGLAAGLWNTGTTNTVVVEYDLNNDGDGNGTLRAYVNGTLAATVTDTSAIGMPDYIHLAFNNGGGTTAGGQFFDSVTLEAIPEPATVGMVGAMGVAMLFIRRCFMI